MTYKREVEALVRKWQRILGLQDWRISVSLAKKFTPLEGSLGTIFYHSHKKEAFVSFVSKSAFRTDHATLEPAVIHELCHLVLIFMDSTKNQHPAHNLLVEQQCEALTRSFCTVGKIPFNRPYKSQ